jgi:ABC-type dipeptide/oligopeptide/nickel transport system permease subunit
VLAARLVPPLARDDAGRLHLLGTDRFGRDLLARSLVAARLSLLVGVLGSLLSGALGLAAGALAGWRGGVADGAITAFADALLAVPRIVLLLVVAALWGPGAGRPSSCSRSPAGWASPGSCAPRCSACAGATTSRRRARSAPRRRGSSGGTSCPTRSAPRPWRRRSAWATPSCSRAGLSFLGLGVQPPAPSWGNLIAGGRELIVVAPWVSLVPGLLLVATVLACTRLGDAVERRERVG